MRVEIIMSIALFLNGVAFSQDSKPSDSDQTTKLGNPITKSQLVELPRRDKHPKINLQQALKIAENFIEQEKIDVSSCYLFEAKWAPDKLDEEPNWRFWWVNTSSDKDIWITVSMNGKPQLLSFR